MGLAAWSAAQSLTTLTWKDSFFELAGNIQVSQLNENEFDSMRVAVGPT